MRKRPTVSLREKKSALRSKRRGRTMGGDGGRDIKRVIRENNNKKIS